MISLLTLAGLALRFGTAMQHGSAWFDESFSLHFASMPLGDMFGLIVHDVHPPLYLFLLNIWLKVFGTTLEMARLFSVLTGTLLVPVIFLLGKSVFGKRTALVAAALTALSPILLFHSGEARMYPLLLLLTALSTWAFLGLLEKGTESKDLWAWTIITSLLLLTHITAVIPFVVAVGFSLAFLKGRGRMRFLLASVASAIPFLVWLSVFVSLRLGGVGSEWQLNSSNAAGSALSRFVDFFFYGGGTWPRAVAAILLIAAFITALMHWKRKQGLVLEIGPERRRDLWYLAVSALLPFLVFLPVHIGTIKYLFVALPATILLVAAGAVKLFRKPWAIVIVSAALVLSPTLYLLTERRIQWDAAAAFIEERERPGDVVYQSWFVSELSMRSYYKGELERLGAYPYEKGLNFNERIVRHAGQIAVTDETLAEMEAFVRPARRVFLVTGASNFSRQPAQLWFFENGWRLTDRFEKNEFSPIILLLENPDF